MRCTWMLCVLVCKKPQQQNPVFLWKTNDTLTHSHILYLIEHLLVAAPHPFYLAVTIYNYVNILILIHNSIISFSFCGFLPFCPCIFSSSWSDIPSNHVTHAHEFTWNRNKTIHGNCSLLSQIKCRIIEKMCITTREEWDRVIYIVWFWIFGFRLFHGSKT